MDELVIKYYRRLLRNGFEHAGSLENPSIFLDSVGEKIYICSHIGRDYMHIYINISGDTIDDIKYKCMCDPTANVVVEILCTLVKGKTLAEAAAITEDSFVQVLGSEGKEFLKKSKGIIELLNRGLTRYQAATV
jgi:NifU-like protein involved in Fe-S cluster formation